MSPVEATDVCSENLSAFAEKWGDDLKNFGKRYIWQWKIPSSVYEILKKNLTWIVSGIFGTQGNIKATIKDVYKRQLQDRTDREREGNMGNRVLAIPLFMVFSFSSVASSQMGRSEYNNLFPGEHLHLGRHPPGKPFGA